MDVKQQWLSIDALLEALTARGFVLGTDTHLRLVAFLEKAGNNPFVELETLKFQLAALLCRSADQQTEFYALFPQFLEDLVAIEPTVITPPEHTEVNSIPETDPTPPEPPTPPPPAPPLPTPKSPDPAAPPLGIPTAGKSGPVRLELRFPRNPLRPWNTASMDRALRPLLEKEWTHTLEWDIPATIRQSIQKGGFLHIETKRRKQAPQYLLLIDQRSPQDHLAGLYAELAAEMNRRDLTAEYYFYDFRPWRCWKDFRDLRSHTNIETLRNTYADYKLLLVGEPDGLLDLPALRPSNLAANLREYWPQMALLCTKPTPAWGNAELALCQLFPVVPAAAEGLATLHTQWHATEVFSPVWWRAVWPEVALPDFHAEGMQSTDALDKGLKHYLGREGYHWLCAAAVYPELYWELTALLNDESIPPQAGASEWDINQRWQIALLRLSRLTWFREGRIPAANRALLLRYFKQKMPPAQRSAVRLQLLEVLGMTENRPPDGSWAAAERAYTIVAMDDARTQEQTALTGADAAQQRAWAREAEALDSAQRSISQADLEEAIGRKLQMKASETPNVVTEPAKNVDEDSGPYAESPPPVYALPYVAFSTANQLNARKGPGISFKSVGTLEKNARVVVLEVSGDWLRIGRERWVNRMYVDRPQALRPEDWLLLATVTPTFSVLWVDDKPEPNRNLRKELTDKYGIQFLVCQRTEEAFQLLKESHFDLIVSDTTREGNPWAGIDMFQELKALGITIPKIVNTSAEKVAQYEAEFLETGALGMFSRYNSMKGLIERLVQEKARRFAPPQAATEQAVFQLLWVDDYPQNNTRWIDVLKAKHTGLVVQTALSTEAALAELDKNQYQAIISDLGRGNNNMEGLRFLETLRVGEISLPIAIFAAQAPQNREVLLAAGAQIATNNGPELLAWVEGLVNAWEKTQLTPPPVVEQTAQTYTPPRLVLDPAMVPERPLKVFVSYARRDRERLNSIIDFLQPLQTQQYIDLWHDQLLDAGQDWQAELNHQLDTADVVLSVVTPLLLDNELIMGEALNRALQRARNHELRIVPLIVEPCDWQSTPLGAWPALPADGDAYSQKTRLEGPNFPWEPLDTLLYNLAISKKENWTWPLEPATTTQTTSAAEDGPLQAGMTLDSRYTLLERIGRGSYGQIWRVEDVQEGVELSLKIELSTKETSVDAFRREYEMLSKLQHLNILRYVYFGVWEGQPYLVMPYYAKGSVARIKGKISEAELWRLAAQMASALAHLHAQSPPILHRDVKPQNILFDHEEGYVLGDFGISGPEGGQLRGLPAVPYRAPECADASIAQYSTASDVWALGVTLYELATGSLPFGGRGGGNTGTTVSLPEQFSPALGALVKVCLAVEPGARPSAKILAREAELVYMTQGQRQAPEATTPAPKFVQDTNNLAATKSPPKTAVKKERTIFQRLFGLGKEEEPEIEPPEMIFVRGGTFQMGEEGIATPVHPVTLSDFEIGKYPVTQKLWVDIMGSNPSQFKGDDLPVERVSWEDVQGFLKKLNARYPDKDYRLPTEAEWEFAARGGTLSKGFTYAGSNDLNEVGWFLDNSNSKTHPVGQKKTNELGIYDMSGNVWEWCSDCYGGYEDSKQPIYNPTGSAAGSSRVNRGGSWNYESIPCRVANRFYWDPGNRRYDLGFRLART